MSIVSRRETGGTVVFIKTTFTQETLASWSVYYQISRPEQNRKRAEALAAGSKGHELWAALDVQPDDLIIEKKRFSAFIQGSSNLAEVLRSRGIDTSPGRSPACAANRPRATP